MSKSLKRVIAAAKAMGVTLDILEVTQSTKTAQQAADVLKVDVDQIAKSILFKGAQSESAILFVTAGGQRVDLETAQEVCGETLMRADADFIRAETGFAIGGVSPIGHLKPVMSFLDQNLLRFETIWAAAGTPHHMFDTTPAELEQLCKARFAVFTE